MVDTSKDGLLLGGGIRHITAHRSSRAEVNKFLLAYVIIIVFKCVYFQHYFACLCERIYCCNVIMLS